MSLLDKDETSGWRQRIFFFFTVEKCWSLYINIIRILSCTEIGREWIEYRSCNHDNLWVNQERRIHSNMSMC